MIVPKGKYAFEMKTITVDQIETGDLLFLCGKTWLADQIQKSQEDKGNVHWFLNHVGIFFYNGTILCVGEEDQPGQFHNNPFKEEYVDTEAEVYVGRYKFEHLSEEGKLKLQREMLLQASEDRLTNYGYLDILSFKLNSLLFKATERDIWIGRKKNKKGRYTCSQRTAKYLQDYFGILKEKDYIEFTPADIADEPCIELFRIIY